MNAMAILLLAAAIAFGVSKFLRLPAIPLLLLCGAALGALLDYKAVEVPDELLKEMIQIGLAVLVFTAGVELSPRRMRGRTRAITILAVSQFFILGASGVVTALFLGYGWTTALYLGCALSASSTLVVVRHLQQRRQMFEPYGRLVLGVLLLQDIFIVLIMVALLKAPHGWPMVLQGMANAMVLGLLAAGFHRWLVPFLFKRLRLDDEELMLFALAVLFAFSALAYMLRLPFLVGAFFAGFAISAFPMNGLVRGMLGSLSGFFLALFFISAGAYLILPDLTMIVHSLIFIGVLVLVTVFLVAIIAEAVGYSSRAGVEAGVLLSQTSEFSLLLALTGVASGQISSELFSMIALITVSTMTLTPFISRESVALRLVKWHPRYRKGENACKTMKNHAVLLGFGRAGPPTLRALIERGMEMVVVDEDASVIRQLIAKDIPCVQGDGSDIRTLERAHCRQAKVVFCSMRRTGDARLALEYLKGCPTRVVVRVFEPSEEKIVRDAGGEPLQTAYASAAQFLFWAEVNLAQTSHQPVSKKA
jgi:CPA2 family monovalent cation:H+ antiporter-2